MDLTGGLGDKLKSLPAEMQPILSMVLDRLVALETKTAADENAIVDKIIATVIPQIQAVTQTANTTGGQALELLAKIERCGLVIRVGEEP